MTEYELVDAFGSHIGLAMSMFLGFISATSAFLITAFVAANRIPPLLRSLVIGIYTLTALFFGVAYNRLISVGADLVELMRESTPWHTTVREPLWLYPSVASLAVTAMVVMYVGSLIYFRHAQQEPTTPTVPKELQAPQATAPSSGHSTEEDA